MKEFERGIEPIGRYPQATGNLRLNAAQLGKSEGFESHQELVEFLTERSLIGTPQEKAEAKKTLDALWTKNVKAIQSGKLDMNFEDKDPDESIIMRTLRKRNELIRKKMRHEIRGDD